MRQWWSLVSAAELGTDMGRGLYLPIGMRFINIKSRTKLPQVS